MLKTVGIFLAACVAVTVSGLKCRKCTYFHGTSHDSGLQSILNDLHLGSVDNCKDFPNSTQSLDCSSGGHSNDWACVHRDNRLTANESGQPLYLRLISRDCEKLKRDEAKKSDACHHDTSMRRKLEALLLQASPSAEVQEVHGHVCVCADNNCNYQRDPHDNLFKPVTGAASVWRAFSLVANLFLFSLFAIA